MKKSFLKFVAAGLLLALISCSSPLDKKFHEATMEKDLQEIVASDKVNKEDLQNLAMYIFRAKMSGENIEGKSYKELIETAKKTKE